MPTLEIKRLSGNRGAKRSDISEHSEDTVGSITSSTDQLRESSISSLPSVTYFGNKEVEWKPGCKELDESTEVDAEGA